MLSICRTFSKSTNTYKINKHLQTSTKLCHMIANDFKIYLKLREHLSQYVTFCQNLSTSSKILQILSESIKLYQHISNSDNISESDKFDQHL